MPPSQYTERTQRVGRTRPDGHDRPLVLVVERSPTQAMRLQAALETDGFRAVVTADPREAVEMARRVGPDAVLADQDTPRVDGFQLCAYFRADAHLRRAAFVLMSNLPDEHDRERAFRAGANGCVSKDTSPRSIAGVMREALAAVG